MQNGVMTMNKPDDKEPEQAYPNLSEQREFARKLLTRDLAEIYKVMKGK